MQRMRLPMSASARVSKTYQFTSFNDLLVEMLAKRKNLRKSVV